MRPILVKEIDDAKGTKIEGREPEVLRESVSPEIAETLNKYLISAVQDGTGKKASLRSVQVAGKTGTAENASGKDHAWFIGYAPAEDPQLAVAVLVEQANSTGGAAAAPIAADILSYGLRHIAAEGQDE